MPERRAVGWLVLFHILGFIHLYRCMQMPIENPISLPLVDGQLDPRVEAFCADIQHLQDIGAFLKIYIANGRNPSDGSFSSYFYNNLIFANRIVLPKLESLWIFMDYHFLQQSPLVASFRNLLTAQFQYSYDFVIAMILYPQLKRMVALNKGSTAVVKMLKSVVASQASDFLLKSRACFFTHEDNVYPCSKLFDYASNVLASYVLSFRRMVDRYQPLPWGSIPSYFTNPNFPSLFMAKNALNFFHFNQLVSALFLQNRIRDHLTVLYVCEASQSMAIIEKWFRVIADSILRDFPLEADLRPYPNVAFQRWTIDNFMDTFRSSFLCDFMASRMHGIANPSMEQILYYGVLSLIDVCLLTAISLDYLASYDNVNCPGTKEVLHYIFRRVLPSLALQQTACCDKTDYKICIAFKRLRDDFVLSNSLFSLFLAPSMKKCIAVSMVSFASRYQQWLKFRAEFMLEVKDLELQKMLGSFLDQMWQASTFSPGDPPSFRVHVSAIRSSLLKFTRRVHATLSARLYEKFKLLLNETSRFLWRLLTFLSVNSWVSYVLDPQWDLIIGTAAPLYAETLPNIFPDDMSSFFGSSLESMENFVELQEVPNMGLAPVLSISEMIDEVRSLNALKALVEERLEQPKNVAQEILSISERIYTLSCDLTRLRKALTLLQQFLNNANVVLKAVNL